MMRNIFYVLLLVGAFFVSGCDLVSIQADAGVDQTVESGQSVILDGSKSTGGSGSLAYQWKQTKGTSVSLSGADTVHATFTAPQVSQTESLSFVLTVTENGRQESSQDSVTITVKMSPDITKPVITLKGENPVDVLQGSSYIDAGATAKDDRDGTVATVTTGTVDTSTLGTYTVTYTAKDKAGNIATASRVVHVVLPPDTIPPTLTLNGESNISLTVGTTYTELGATAVDDRDGNVSVDINGTVDTSTLGIYTLTYTAKDKAGNVAKAERAVTVIADTTNPDIEELRDILDDPTIPYTTDADFNKTEYAKHHLADDEAKKLERAHMLVATAIDPDPEWFYTDVDKSVIVTQAGTEHTVYLKKMRKDGTVYAPVDNDKLRLVVRVQRSKNNFEYITNVNIDQYAHWDGAGVLKINVPQDLDKGRLIVGVRPNFDDVAMSAIAERWSAVISAEVWQVKAGVTELESDNVLFPIDDASIQGLSPDSQFTIAEISQKVQTELTANKTLLLPMVVKNMSLSKDDKLSYIFQGKPYAGEVIFVEKKGGQDFVLLAPKLFDVYNITDADDGFMIKEGLYPENIIIREGDRLDIDQNESDPVEFKKSKSMAKSIGDIAGFFNKSCTEGNGLLTIQTVFDISVLDAGLDVVLYGMKKETKCTWKAVGGKLKLNPAYFAVGGPLVLAMKAVGMEGELNAFGQLELVAKDAAGLGLEAGYTIQKGGNFQFNYPKDAGSRNLNDVPTTATGEISGTFGVQFDVKALSADAGMGWVLHIIGVDITQIAVEATSGIKAALLATGKNAREVEKSGSSELAISLGIDINFKLTESLRNWLNYFGVHDATLEIKYYKDLIDPLKAKADFYFSSVKDNGQGEASVIGLMPNSYAIHLFTPNDYEGVLSIADKTSSVWNNHSENISYDLEECAKTPDYKITSPAIACAGWMCGVVDKEVVLCKGKLSISDVVASAKVGELASTGASIINKAGEIDVTISGSPLVPQTTSLHMAADSAEYVVFEKMCTKPGVDRGTTTVTAEGTNLSADASNTLLCHDDDTHGDPHIVTGDKLGYDYYASGDYVLSRIKDITGYEVQARFLPGYQTSWPQAVALNVGGDVVEIQGVKRDGHGDGSGIPINALAIWVNGKKGILGTDDRYSHWNSEDSISKRIAKLPSGGLIAVTHTDSSNVLSFASDITVIWPEGSPAQNYGAVLSVAKSGDPFVHIQIARPDDYVGQEQGLMGNNDGDPSNDFIRRNGEVLGVDHNMSFTELYALFGADWLVRPYESLFRNPEAIKPQFPTDVVTLTPEQRALGEQACAALTGFYREACIIDVGLTGNADLVKEYYANTEDLNTLSDAIVTPDVDQARYTMSVADKAYEADSGYYLHYKQNITILHEAGEGRFMLLVRSPRGATAQLGTGEMSHTAEGNYTTHIEVDCTELNEQTNSEFLLPTGSLQLWLQDPLSGTASKMLSEVALPCTDASKRAGFSLRRGTRVELDDSNDTNLHYTQPLGVVHTNSYAGEYILEISPPQGAVVKLNESSSELNITDSVERNDTLELDCSMAESNASNGSIKLWEKDMLSGVKAYNYANYSLSCYKSKVLKTGQTTSYVDYDDGDYQTGEARSYTRDNDKEVVIDNVTGLMWQDNSEAKTVTKPWVTQANYNAGKYNDTSGDTAATYCSNLTLGSYEDWRLPTRKELLSIVDLGRFNPSLDPEFLNFASSYYWSSTTNANNSGNAWFVNFFYGNQHYGTKYDDYYVRCVRAGQ
jgi:hypothetical protein